VVFKAQSTILELESINVYLIGKKMNRFVTGIVFATIFTCAMNTTNAEGLVSTQTRTKTEVQQLEISLAEFRETTRNQLDRLTSEIAELQKNISSAQAERASLLSELNMVSSQIRQHHRVFETPGWKKVVPGQSYEVPHTLGCLPRFATARYSETADGSNPSPMTGGIFENSGGYGTWIQNLSSSKFEISTGRNGVNGHYGEPRHKRDDVAYVKVILIC